MIYLTESPNDADMLPLLNGLGISVPIPHGDFAFFGKWLNGETINICGDRKKLGDLLGCVQGGRHIQQIQDARAAGFDRIFLVVEGVWRYGGETGMVEEPRANGWNVHPSKTPNQRLWGYLNELEWYAGVSVTYTRGPRGTASYVKNLHNMLQVPPESHSSLNQYHTPPPPALALYGRPSLVERVAKELPGISWARAKAVGKQAISVQEVVNWTRQEWMEVEGIGSGTADKVVKALERVET